MNKTRLNSGKTWNSGTKSHHGKFIIMVITEPIFCT